MKGYLKIYFLPGMIVLALAITFLFFIKIRVQELSRNIKQLNSQILLERESIHILKAEYSYLTSPQRLKELTKKELNLQLPKNSQLMSFEQMKVYLSQFVLTGQDEALTQDTEKLEVAN